MFSEDDLLPVSALQHLAFCERQWGLMYLEGIWEENVLTAEGGILHEQTDEPETEVRGDLRIARALRLRSLRLGLSGIADTVEFHRARADAPGGASRGVELPGVRGRWMPFPVEYKRGKPKADHCDEIQLCAQAMCLEEMLAGDLRSPAHAAETQADASAGPLIPAGALFYGQTRHRHDVALDAALRGETEAFAVRLHELFAAGRTPIARYEKKCRSCSIFAPCMPKTAGAHRSVERYLAEAMPARADEGGPP